MSLAKDINPPPHEKRLIKTILLLVFEEYQFYKLPEQNSYLDLHVLEQRAN